MSTTTPSTIKRPWPRRLWHFVDGRYAPDGGGRPVQVPGRARTVDVRLLVPGTGAYLVAKAITATLLLLGLLGFIAVTALVIAGAEDAANVLVAILVVDLVVALLFATLQNMLKPLRAVFVADVDRW